MDAFVNFVLGSDTSISAVSILKIFIFMMLLECISTVAGNLLRVGERV